MAKTANCRFDGGDTMRGNPNPPRWVQLCESCQNFAGGRTINVRGQAQEQEDGFDLSPSLDGRQKRCRTGMEIKSCIHTKSASVHSMLPIRRKKGG